MSRIKRTSGLTNGAADVEKAEIRFTLVIDGKEEDFVGKRGVVEQIISGLARMYSELKARAVADRRPYLAPVERVTSVHVQRDGLSGLVSLQFETALGIRYGFAIPPQAAIELASRLKTESERDDPAGNA